MAAQKIREPHEKYRDDNFSRNMLATFVLKLTKIVLKHLIYFSHFFPSEFWFDLVNLGFCFVFWQGLFGFFYVFWSFLGFLFGGFLVGRGRGY